MNNAYRFLVVFWVLTGMTFAIFGIQGFMENPIQKVGRLWVVSLLPAIFVTVSWASFVLANGFWRGKWYVSPLGRAMSLILFTGSMFPLVWGITLLAVGPIEIEALGYLVACVLGIAFTVFNYKISKHHRE